MNKMKKQQARAAVLSDDSDTEQDDRGDFHENKRYAANRKKEVYLLRYKGASISAHMLITDRHFTAILTGMEEAKCPQAAVAIFIMLFEKLLL